MRAIQRVQRRVLRGGAGKILLESGISDFIQAPIPIPSRTYTFNHARASEFLKIVSERLSRSTRPYMNAEYFRNIIKNTKHVSFATYIHNLKNAIRKFETYIKGQPFAMFIPNDSGKLVISRRKSNYWMSQMVFHLLKVKPLCVTTSVTQIQQYKNVLVCDDGIYSATQLSESLFNMIRSKKAPQILNVHIIAPYVSEFGIENMDNLLKLVHKYEPDIARGKSITIYYDVIMKSLVDPIDIHKDVSRCGLHKTHVVTGVGYKKGKNYYGMGPAGMPFKQLYCSKEKNTWNRPKQIPIYFDHKLPDFMSSYPDIYGNGNIVDYPNNKDIDNKFRIPGLINGCEAYGRKRKYDSVKPPCPPPPYKNINTVHAISLTPAEFLRRFQ